MGEACSHVAALLFKVELGVRTKVHMEEAGTSRACEWSKVSHKVQFVRNSEIEYIKPSTDNKKQKRHVAPPKVNEKRLRESIKSSIAKLAPESVLGITLRKEQSAKILPRLPMDFATNVGSSNVSARRKTALH